MEKVSIFKGSMLWLATGLAVYGMGVMPENLMTGLIVVGASLLVFVVRELLKKYFNADL